MKINGINKLKNWNSIPKNTNEKTVYVPKKLYRKIKKALFLGLFENNILLKKYEK